MSALKVNILLHGLFFMTQEGANLRVYAPNIPDHHFIGGIRGARQELSVSPDLTRFGLRGKADPQTGLPAPDSANDIDGSIMQFSPGDVGGFKDLGATNPQTHQPLFKGSILLPWPMAIIGLRTDVLASFRAEPGTIRDHILNNANGKGSSTLGVVALLRYTLPGLNSTGGITHFNVHYYLQPCNPHNIGDVNNDLLAAQNCFRDPAGFDLKFIDDGNNPTSVPPTGDSDLGIAAEDVQSFDEERTNKTPDAVFICRNDPPVQNVSPANCPIFFVGP